tara:strand:- start:30 stop:1589 length:1560 start_codon:yes stop_codon:yes gene_type:complete
MSYQVLARKYRPNSFDEVIGQDHIVQVIKNSIEQERVHQAFLFSGTRGVGKTTIARLLAKCLNCMSSDSPTSEPCGKCDSSIGIQEGKSIDFLEIDAASRTGVEHMRELLSSVHTSPSVARYKIFLIDEVHMLSKGSFNALLKTLEEPPSHVIFLMATTDPEKVPKTVISRCLQLNLKTVSRTELCEHFRNICKKEGIQSDDESLSLVAKAADGSVRDGLTLLDQAIAHGSGKLDAHEVKSLLGTIDDSLIHELLESIVDGRKEDTFMTLNEIEKLNPDYESLLKDLISNIHEISLHQVIGDSNNESISNIATKIDAQYCQLIYEIGLNSVQKIHTHPSPREAVEMCLLRMLAFQPVQNINEGDSKTQKKKTDKPSVKESQKEKQIVNKIVDENEEITSSSWPDHFNKMQLSSFAKNYFGNLSYVKSNDKSMFLCGSKDQLDIPEKILNEFQDKIHEEFGKIEVVLEEGISSSSPNKINEEKKLKDIEDTKKELSNNSEIKDFLNEFEGQIETVTKIKN